MLCLQIHIVVLLFGEFGNSLGDLNWNSFYATYGDPEKAVPGKDAFFALPRTSSQAESEGWVTIPEEAGQYFSTWCLPDDPLVCLLYNKNGIIAGCDISVLSDDIDGHAPYPIDNHIVFRRLTRFNHKVVTVTVYLEDPDNLEAGGRQNLDNGTATGVWVRYGNSNINIPTEESEIAAQTNFTKENCVPGMGTHYYYNISESMICEDFEPFALIVNATERLLHGFLFQSFGKPRIFERPWYEDIPSAAVKMTIPNAPQCLVDWAETYGIISIHLYLKEDPWTIPCPK